jgi:AcrR family transcriptional regulator
MGRPPRIDRAHLLDKARELFSSRGFEGTTLADIATALGVTPAGVLRRVGTKEQLFVEAMGSGLVELPPFFAELDQAPVEPDPRLALRRFAEQFVPFGQERMAEAIAVYMHAGSRMPIPIRFDPKSKTSPPLRGFPIIERYFARAAAAGTLKVRDVRAATILFAGSLHSYAFLHQVLNVFDTPFPLASYLDTLFDVWTGGAIAIRRSGRNASPRSGGPGDRAKTRRT